MSHMLVYGADELHFLKALALVVWFSKRCISTGEVRSYGFKLAFPVWEGEVSCSRERRNSVFHHDW